MILSVLLFWASSCQNSGQKSPDAEIRIIPKPVSLVVNNQMLMISDGVKIENQNSSLKFAGEYLISQLKNLSQKPLFENPDASVVVILKLDSTIAEVEGYQLDIDKDITISGKTKNGVLYGIQSLLQILNDSRETSGEIEIPTLKVNDYPRFQYRGMHLDVSRHFFDVAFVKKYIDLIAMHKMNTFHWHLTDDQGWRIEIKKYPKLTEIGAWRVDREDLSWNERPDQKTGEKATYGGFYTQDQIREVVAYATERGITVIPEIEMPGHSAATIAAYPEYSCAGKPTVVPSGGISKINILCAGKDETFNFLQDVLSEVIDLFPSKYIHIGGDEAWKHEWEKCPLCQKRIKDQHLANEHELQSYFIQRIEHFLTSKGRALIGWDEILEGGLAENATVMSWRGEAGGIKAAQMKHDVVMTPVDYCYFDYYQSLDTDQEPLAFNGYISLSKVYNYEPVPKVLTAEEAKYVLGAQGNVWSEFMPTNDLVEYRVLPRMTALSEVLWSPKELRNEADFMNRLEPFLKWLTKLNYRFHIPAPGGVLPKMIFLDSARVELSNPWSFAEIRYTLDGNEPTVNSPVYTEAMKVAGDAELKTGIFLHDGRHGLIKTAVFRKVSPIDSFPVDTTKLVSGLSYQYLEVAVSTVEALDKLKPKSSGVMKTVGLPAEHRTEVFAAGFKGYFYAPETKIYTFALSSDDGSRLYLADQLLIDHDGYHGPTTEYGQIALSKGYYPVRLGYFDGGGGNSLNLQLKQSDGTLTDIPENQFFHF